MDNIETVTFGINEAQKCINRFKSELEKNPATAFQWSEDAMQAAAELQVWMEIEKYRQNGATAERLVELSKKEALRGARRTSTSSNATINLMNRFRTAAFAKVAEELEYVAKYEAKIAA